ncbi:MAG: DUF4387 domain-containing protein [Armatimonadota bacterium]
MRLYDLATTIRSKNAGPFRLTIDLVLPDAGAFARVLASEEMQPERIAALYDVAADDVNVIPFERILTVKVALPRPGASSGAPGDRDVYGCGQHFPLADVDV